MNTEMNLQRISINRLKPAKYNPRKDLKPAILPMKRSGAACMTSAMSIP